MAGKEYIDREILLKMNFYTENCNSEENRWNDYAIKDIIRHIPAADVAPVKHGYWKSVNGVARCSNCEYVPSYDYVVDDIFYSDYCPICGAKMDEGSEENNNG